MSSRLKNTSCFEKKPPCDVLELSGLEIPVSTFLRHCAILGSSGSGKTVAAKVLCEEFAIRNIPVIAIDPQGDIASLMTPGNPTDISDRNGNLEHARLFNENVDVVVWTPTSDSGVQICVNPLELNFHSENCVREITTTAQNLASLLGYDLRKDAGKFTSGFFDIVLTYIYENKLEVTDFKKLSKFLSNPPKLLLEDIYSVLNPNEVKDIIRKVRLLTIGAKKLLFGSGVSLDVDTLLGTGGKRPRISVIYLNSLTTQEEKNFFVSQLALSLYGWMLENPQDYLQAVFYIDEIAPFLPPVSKPASKDILRLLFKQARKYGVGCMLATQNPGDVDYRSMAQISTYFLGRMMTDQDIKKVDQVIKSLTPDPKAVTSVLPNLKAGNFKMISPDISSGIRDVKFRWLYSKHVTYDESDLSTLITSEMRSKFGVQRDKPKNIASNHTVPDDIPELLTDDEIKLLLPTSKLKTGILLKHSPMKQDFIVVGKPANGNMHIYTMMVIDKVLYCGKYGITYVTKRNRFLYYPLSRIRVPLFLRMFINPEGFINYVRPFFNEERIFVCYNKFSTLSSFDALIKYGTSDKSKVQKQHEGVFVDYPNPLYHRDIFRVVKHEL